MLSPSPGCIPKVGPSGLDFLCLDPPGLFSPVSISSFPENLSSRVLELLGGIEVSLAAHRFPHKSIPKQLRFMGELVQGPQGPEDIGQ